MLIIKNLNKKFSKLNVLEGINHEFLPGLNKVSGRNGAGKTSLLKLIGNQDKEYDGLIRGNDFKEVSFMPDVLDSFPSIRVKTLLESLCKEFKMDFEKQVLFLKDTLDLKPFFDQKISELSLGQKKKIILFLSMIKNRKIWVIDEPFAALDKESVPKLIEFLKNNSHRIIVLTTHRSEIDINYITILELK